MASFACFSAQVSRGSLLEEELKLSHTCPMIRDRMGQGGLAAVEAVSKNGPGALIALLPKTTRA